MWLNNILVSQHTEHLLDRSLRDLISSSGGTTALQDPPDQAEECDFFGVAPAFAGGIESTAACRSGFIARAADFVSAVFAS